MTWSDFISFPAGSRVLCWSLVYVRDSGELCQRTPAAMQTGFQSADTKTVPEVYFSLWEKKKTSLVEKVAFIAFSSSIELHTSFQWMLESLVKSKKVRHISIVCPPTFDSSKSCVLWEGSVDLTMWCSDWIICTNTEWDCFFFPYLIKVTETERSC